MRKLLLVSAVIAAGLGANARAATVSGTVFRDINANGLYGNTGPTAEPPIGGVTLNAIDELGNTTSVTSNATTGAYSITLPGNQLRIEAVTTIRLFPGASGFASPGPRTTVLFTTGNQTARDIGFSNPQQFCQDSPNVAANVYSNGNPNTTGTAGTNSWMVRGPFNFSPDNNPANATIVNGQIIGSTFGLVYQRSTDSLFAAAFLKRHSGLGIGDGNPVVAANTNTNETGAIYRIANPNAASPVASLLIDVQAFGINTGSVTRVENGATADFEAPPTVATSPNIDADAFDKVGKVGLGALTLSEDERTLWALNLNDRTVLQIPLTIAGGVPTAIGAGIVTHNVGASAAAPTCTNGVFRPFALKEMDGFVYVGGVCTAETGGTAADLRAAVLRLDPQAAPGTFTSVLNVPLNYPRGSASDDGVTPTNAAWRPWRATWGAIVAPAPGAATYGQTIQPQPILSDIEFDADGSMILSFIDRLSHQAGNGNYSPLAADGSPRATYEGAAGGDVLLACFSGGTWTLESAGGCGTRFSDATTGGQGPGNGEFFWHDKYQGATYPPDQTINVGGHREITLGGAAVHAVRREMVSSVFDPRTAFRAAGYRMFNLVDFDLTATNNAGETARSVEIFGQDAGGGLPVRFGKAAGIGNVEMMCSPPPIEIGNRVWLDSDRDGVQDPNEAPVANVAMTLYSAAGAVLGRTTTSAAGEWYFTFSVGATDASTADNNVILPAPFFQNYFVAIDANNFASGQPLFARSRTTANADPSANGDARDSDGTPAAIPSVGTLTAFALSTGGPGANDHTIDFGFLSPDLGDLPDATAGTGANDYQTLIANGGPVHPIVPGLFLGTSVDGEADGQPSAGATGDDTNGGDDEDGITVANLALTQNVAPVVNFTATNTTSSAARMCGFIDYNADGDFADAGESTSVAVPNGSINAAFVLNFGIVPTGSATTSFARFRLSSDTAGACVATGVATDGEVEDYPVTIAANNDLGDLPDSGAGVGANNYETLNASGGPSHPIVAGLRLGATVDNEADGQPNAGATGDGADEDGITVANLSLTQNVAPVVNLTATNTTGTAARVCGFIDYNADGDFADAGESANVAVPTGSNNAPFVLNFGVVPTGSATASFARFRLSTDTAGACAPNGVATNGEVEDYAVTIGTNNDLGDLPDTGVGVGANNYETLNASGGPSHPIVAGLRLGATVDNEADGQPNAGATGDGADEDGITVANLSLTQNVAPVVNLTATNTTGTAARVCGFIDYNADGDFADAGESANVAVPNGSNNAALVLNFGVVPTGSASASFARFRLSTDTAGACAPNGVATNGEVEDYAVTIAANNDLGDLPDSGAGVGANNYETLNANGGPSHPIVAGLRLGATVDNEADGQPNAGATGDGADEDGITVANLSLTQNVAPVVNLTATNTTGSAARVCGFIDYNADGDFADAGESANVAVPTGSNNAPFVLNFGVVPTGSATASFARFRLSTDTAGACAPNGVATNGEVEDYAVTIGTNNDLGDLPDSGAGVGANNYETLNASGGPSHPIVAGLRLGATVDNEGDGQPNVGATGDGADEDGITAANLSLTQNVAPVVNLTATNTTGTAARVCGFIDYNADGDFADAGESANVAVPTGSNNAPFILNFGIVPTGSATASFARFRLSTDTVGACAPNGVATNGEVEDYAVTIASNNDLGDLPDTGVGVGANNYETLNASGGPSHPIVAGLRLGATVDNEADGQPNAGATGDGADEDGITVADLNLTVGVAPAVNLTATNTTGSAARACGFIDFNGDGDFADAGESANVAVPTGSNNAAFVLNFGAVPFGSATATFARFRLSTDTAGACAPNGAATNGEVEDYVAGVAAPSDLGDLPDTGPGTGAGNYETASANGGPRHPQRAGLRLGATIDTEADGQPSVGANGDGADEDGVTLADLAFVAGAPANVRVTVTNTTGTAARVCGFVDFNADGDFADASEATQVAVADGSTNATLTLAFGTVPANVAASSYARFRLSTATSACAATGAELDGEVEDYVTSGSSFDLGDLPDGTPGVGAGNYQTLLTDGGARHPIVTGIQLGATIDAEADGQPNAGATGDGVDEDGVTFPVAGFELGSPARAQIVASDSAGTPALVCGFIDWNGDGDFDDAAERAQGTVAAGAVNAALTLDFGTSPTSVAATIYSRFRISTDPACAPAGDATNGEVEDYVVPTTGNGALSLGDLVWEDSNNNGQVDGGEAGIAGIPVTLYRDDNQDCQADGAALATQPTTGTGGYLFTDLLPGNYIVEIQPPSTYLGSTGSGRYTPTGPFEPGPDPDNDVNNDDNGRNITPTVIRACTVQLTAKAEPTTDGDVDNNTNLSVDFGLVRNFDLALRKTLSPGQASVVRVGDTVSFTITVYNQGAIPATNVQITDYIPAGMALNDAAWTAIGLNNATRVIAGPIAPGGSSAVTIGLRITTPSTVGYRNLAEIDTAQDGTGGTPTDIDSIPDTDGGNDGPPTDDAIDNSNNDEDDSDIATVTIATGVPANASWALIVLIAAMLMIGLGRRRRMS